MKVRDWECGCGHAWTAPVVLAKHTPNLSGEATQWCPRCDQRPVMGSPVREEGESMNNTTTTYTIKPGSIAAVQHIECDDGRRMTAIYMSEERQPEVHLDGRGLADIRDTLPTPVLAALNRNFGLMFSLPVERRQSLIDNIQPMTVTVEGETA